MKYGVFMIDQEFADILRELRIKLESLAEKSDKLNMLCKNGRYRKTIASQPTDVAVDREFNCF